MNLSQKAYRTVVFEKMNPATANQDCFGDETSEGKQSSGTKFFNHPTTLYNVYSNRN